MSVTNLPDVIIQSHGHAAAIVPHVGGSVRSWELNNQPIFRAGGPDAADPLDMGLFPLVPWSNRIRDGRFTWDGVAVHIPPNMLPQRHAIHGLGWHSAWGIAASAPDSVTLRHEHATQDPQGHWPWAYTALLTYALDAAGLSISLEVQSKDDRTQPLGLGVHPYFVRLPVATLHAPTGGYWERDDEIMPTRHIEAPAHDLTPWLTSGQLVDHVFTGLTGPAVLISGAHRITLDGALNNDRTRWLVVYAPPEQPLICVEPVTHPTDALNQPGTPGILALAPGATATYTARIDVSPA